MSSHFLAYMARMRLIKRWGLRRNTTEENDMEHTLMVAMIAHLLAELRIARQGGSVNMERLLGYAIYHEAAEVITGDLASPIKYFNPEIKDAFKYIEQVASNKLLSYLPSDLQPAYAKLLLPDEQSAEWKLVKAADKISAYLKCTEELGQGNEEFSAAQVTILAEINRLNMPEIGDFMQEFVPSFRLSLDALN